MANFVAVLKNAIDGLGDYRPVTREKVYQRARATLAARLAVVGPPPVAVVERQKRVLEDAIAEVERSYVDEIDDDPVVELASTFEHSRQPATRETAALEAAPTTERAGPMLPAEDRAPEPPAPMNAAAASDAGEAYDLPELAPPADTLKPSDPAVVEVADFHVPGEANAALGNDLFEVLATEGDTMETGAIGPSALKLASAHQLEWGSSSLCGLCQRWAVCIDQTHCWHRTDR